MMKDNDIVEFVQKTIEPIYDYDENLSYRCSVTLKDGMVLPCVIVQSKDQYVDKAIKAIELVRGKVVTDIYREKLARYLCSESQVFSRDIENIDVSPNAILPDRMKEIVGETSMNWTQFTAEMKDGKKYEFGTMYSREFFHMPEGYMASDIVKIVPAERGTPIDFDGKVLRSRPYFMCYVNGM